MKKTTFLIFALLFQLVFGLQLCADKLTIHHIGVGQGDATLIVAEQTNPVSPYNTIYTTILIDAGNSTGKGAAVFNYMVEAIGGLKRVNFVITSHLHSDHIGGMSTVLYNMYLNGWAVDYILDRGASKVPDPDTCYDANTSDPYWENDDVDPVSLPKSKMYEGYEYAVQKYYPNRRYNINPGVDLFRVLGRPSSMSMPAIAANACVLTNYNSSLFGCYDPKNLDENDFSYVFLLTFQGYRYFTGGDVGGGPPYLNLETPIARYLGTYPVTGFHCCSYKASHHGSANSTNDTFLIVTKPSMTVVPSALRSFNGTQLPGQSTLQALHTAGSRLYYTYIYNTNPYSGTVSAYQDIYIQVTDPGFGKNIIMTIGYRQRSKSSPYGPTQPFSTTTDTCKQAHNAPTMAESSELVKPEPATIIYTPHGKEARTLKRKYRKLSHLERQSDIIDRKRQKLLEH